MVFFFKQKTAYEMRISDWSSDVCSSDLQSPLSGRWLGLHLPRLSPPAPAQQHPWRAGRRGLRLHHDAVEAGRRTTQGRRPHPHGGDPRQVEPKLPQREGRSGEGRSEERRDGKEWGRTCRARGATEHEKKKKKKKNKQEQSRETT